MTPWMAARQLFDHYARRTNRKPAGWGEMKKLLRMVEEGSVLFSSAAQRRRRRNVAPADFPHPVYRSGFALAIPIPTRVQS